MPEANISSNILSLIEKFREAEKADFVPQEWVKIKVDKIVSKLALLYEKVRNVIDYNEERLIRRNAIRRILKRKVLYKILSKNSALPLIEELIRAGYLENDRIPENKVPIIENTIDKYLILKEQIGAKIKNIKEKMRFHEFVLGLMACEIEEKLVPEIREKALADCMYAVVKKNVHLPSDHLSEKDQEVLYYVNVHRSLLQYDQLMVYYLLFKLSFSNWVNASAKEIDLVSQNYFKIKTAFDRLINKPESERLFRLFKKYNVLFLILRDIIEKNPDYCEEIFEDQEKLEESIKEAVDIRYKMAQSKLRRSVIRSIIYIFVTKMVLALILEFPVDIFIEKQINYYSLITNISFPPLLMFLVGLSVRVPSVKNTKRIIQLIGEVVYEDSNEGLYRKLSKSKKRSFWARQFFRLVYLVMYLITFGIIIYALHQISFNAVNIIVFLFFLTVVSFFGFRIRQTAKELEVLPEKEGLLTLLVDFFSIPILKAGRWLSLKLSKINIFVFIMDIIIEAPFKSLIEIIEDWLSFIREKKEEIT